ncbi:MAG TPA: CGNR zinc finger domain-containing protein [Silvibacterium sp.]|nr:CGNR zinc finger domain-containing protein [Silvibacterium sp.]
MAIDGYHLYKYQDNLSILFKGLVMAMNEPGPPAFQLVAGHPALDLINTLDWRFREDGAEELLKSYDDLLRFAEQSKILTPRQTRQLMRTVDSGTGARVLKNCTELREAMAEVFYAGVDGRIPSAAVLRKLERSFKAAQANQTLYWGDSRLAWDWSETAEAAELPLWLLSLNSSELMVSEAMHSVRACDNAECRWLFLDTSKNHTRRWCDMKICGNRMKARRFKARQQAPQRAQMG